jgi:hypothetical protein
MKRLFLCVLCLLAIACSGDSDDSTEPVVPCFDCDITSRTAVLSTLELAFNRRNISNYSKLLDDNFTFWLAPGDVAHGLPENWGRQDELLVATNMMDPNYQDVGLRVTKIQVDLKWEGGVQWQAVAEGDETWYMATIFNEYRFEVGPDIFLSKNGAQVQLTVRNAGTEAEPAWRLVEWRELDTDESAIGASLVATDQRSWGEIKAMYLP